MAPDREPDRHDALRRDLGALFGPEVRVPPALDAAVTAAARARLRSRRPAPVLALRLAAAAAILLALLFGWWAWQAADSVAPATDRVAAIDFDEDGRVDVLDAFALARRVESGAPVPARWDLDGDGRVDRADAAVIARRAVAIGRAR